jgi:hypothetical protein
LFTHGRAQAWQGIRMMYNTSAASGTQGRGRAGAGVGAGTGAERRQGRGGAQEW